MPLQSQDDREAKFAEFLISLARGENRGALAALRRGLSSGSAASAGMHRYVAGWVATEDRAWDQHCFYLVAALFGRYPSTLKVEHNFGGSCRELMLKRGSDSFDRRFVALLAADSGGVGVHLRHAVSLLAAEEIGIDWAQLLRDLRRWGHSQRLIQRRWAREFWKYSAPLDPGQAVSDKDKVNQ